MAKLAMQSDVYFGDAVFRAGPLTELQLGEQYSLLMHRLYHKDISDCHFCNPDRMRQVLQRPDCMMSFVVHDEQLVATAEALLVRSEPFWNVFFGNIITRNGWDGNGLGSLAHDSLEREACKHWGHDRPLHLVLTNNAKKGNAPFYTKRGWVPTTTTVFAKYHPAGSV